MFGSEQSLTFSRTLALQSGALIALLQCGELCRGVNKDMTVGEFVKSVRDECVYECRCVCVCLIERSNSCQKSMALSTNRFRRLIDLHFRHFLALTLRFVLLTDSLLTTRKALTRVIAARCRDKGRETWRPTAAPSTSLLQPEHGKVPHAENRGLNIA